MKTKRLFTKKNCFNQQSKSMCNTCLRRVTRVTVSPEGYNSNNNNKETMLALFEVHSNNNNFLKLVLVVCKHTNYGIHCFPFSNILSTPY